MKYTKTAAALAMAGIAASPLAQADGHEGGPVVTLSGGVAINLASDDSDATDGDWNFNGDDSTLNIAATDTLSNGLTGYANYRLDSALSGSVTGGDSIHIGIKGDFGDLRIGEVDNAIEYGQMAGDILADVGATVNGGIGYTNTFGGVTLGLTFAPAGNESVLGAGVKFSAGGFGIGIGAGQQSNQDFASLSVGASFSFGGASVALAYKDYETSIEESEDGEVITLTGVDSDGNPAQVPFTSDGIVNTLPRDVEAISANVSFSVGDVGMGLTYEVDQGDADTDKIRLDASYGLGGGWGTSARVNVTDDVTDYRLQFSKSF